MRRLLCWFVWIVAARGNPCARGFRQWWEWTQQRDLTDSVWTFGQGYQAFIDGIHHDNNPYDGAEAQEWIDGWVARAREKAE